MIDLASRRAFLKAASAAGVAWAAADLSQVEEALAWARQSTAGGSPAVLAVLTPGQGAALEAVAARIFPSIDGRPGARELGVLPFLDKALGSYAAPQKTLLAEGVRDLDARAQALAPGTGFAALTPGQQDTILHAIETTEFFQAMRMAAIVGALALPAYGGNRDFGGWHLLGLDHQPSFQAPFGYYDAQVAPER